MTQPWTFLVLALQRIPIYLMGQWAFPPSEVVMFFPISQTWIISLAGVAIVTPLAVAVAPILRADRLARFFALGMFLSLIPICAAFPGDRVLFFAGLGAMGLLARFLQAVRRGGEIPRAASPSPLLSSTQSVSQNCAAPADGMANRRAAIPDRDAHTHSRSMPRYRVAPVSNRCDHGLQDYVAPAAVVGTLFQRIVTVALLILHVGFAPLALALRSGFPAGPPSFMHRVLARDVLDPSVEDRDLILLNPPSAFLAHLLPISNDTDGFPVPRRLRALCSWSPSLTLRRVDEHTLVVRPDEGFIARVMDALFRDAAYPVQLGQRVELAGMTVEITALTEDGRPAEAAFHFDVALEDPSLVWLEWKKDRFRPFTPPPVGATLVVTSNMPFPW